MRRSSSSSQNAVALRGSSLKSLRANPLLVSAEKARAGAEGFGARVRVRARARARVGVNPQRPSFLGLRLRLGVKG